MGEHFHGVQAFMLHGLTAAPFWLALAGIVSAWFLYLKRPELPALIQSKCMAIYRILENKYGFDSFNEKFFAGGSRFIGGKLWQIGDVAVIDGFLVNGTARLIGRVSAVIRHLQSGLIYHYAFAMIIGVFVLLTFFMKT
jgi:NADH-quinone oxidoreductase subunit L